MAEAGPRQVLLLQAIIELSARYVVLWTRPKVDYYFLFSDAPAGSSMDAAALRKRLLLPLKPGAYYKVFLGMYEQT